MTDPAIIRQALAKLPNPHRELIYRAYYLKRSTAQLAVECGTSESVVRAQLHDAMREFRRALRDVHVTV